MSRFERLSVTLIVLAEFGVWPSVRAVSDPITVFAVALVAGVLAIGVAAVVCSPGRRA